MSSKPDLCEWNTGCKGRLYKSGRNVVVKRNMVFVCINGLPTPLKRHRSCILNGVIHTYDSQKELKKKVLQSVLMQLPHGFTPLCGPLEMIVEFYFPIPKAVSKKRRRDLIGQPHDKMPDLSNLIKFFEDTFNGVLYVDDRYISKITAIKIQDEIPRTLICIKPLEESLLILQEYEDANI